MSGETDTPKTSKRWKRVLGKVARIIVITVVLVLFAGFTGITFPIEIAFHLIAGPFMHAWENLPPFLLQWRSALLPLGCLVVAIVLAHRFIRWWITSKDVRVSWHWGHTASAALLLLLGSAAAIAMSGITHQAAWLFSGPWVEDSSRSKYTSKIALATRNARQIMLALEAYRTEHGRYPDTLDEAIIDKDAARQLLWVNAGPGRLLEPFIFLKPGRPSSKAIEPVLISPYIQGIDKIVVGFSDTSVRLVTLKTWQKMQKDSQTSDE
jgi:hypothetical protein